MKIKQFIYWLFQSTEPKAVQGRRIIKLFILLVLFVALFWIIPISSVIQALLSTDPILFIIGVTLGLLSVFLTAIQMEPLIRNQGIKRNIAQLFAINMAVKFYLQFTPTTLVGSGIRWYRISQPEGKGVESFVALALFRGLEIFTTLAMGLGFYLISTVKTLRVSVGWVVLLILGIIFSWILITRYSLSIYGWVKNRLDSKLNQCFIQILFRNFEKLFKAISAYSNMSVLDLLLIISLGIMSAFAVIASGVILANAVGINLGFLDMGWIQSIVYLASILPITVAGGLGIREVSLVAILSIFNINAEQALALSFLIFIRGIIIALLGGAIEVIDTIQTKRATKLHQLHDEIKET